MRSREVRKLLFDVEKACDLVLKFTRGITLDAFLRDDMVQSAVERQSEIIGEALKQAVGLDQTLSERISDVSRIIAFRVIPEVATLRSTPSAACLRVWDAEGAPSALAVRAKRDGLNPWAVRRTVAKRSPQQPDPPAAGETRPWERSGLPWQRTVSSGGARHDPGRLLSFSSRNPGVPEVP
jgi:hypothetical protein